MHTEHLQNVRAKRVVAGWLFAAALTSLIMLALAGLGVMAADGGDAGVIWPLVAVAAGFLGGGFLAGFRALEAPILHAVAIGLTSLIVWAVVNGVIALLFRDFQWTGLTPGTTVAVLLVQIVAAVFGALLGYNMALRGRPGLSE